MRALIGSTAVVESFIYPDVTGQPMTDCEMAFFAWTRDEREARALARCATLPKNATIAQIELVAIEVFVAAMTAAGHTDEVECYNGTNFDYRRRLQ